MYKPTKYSLTTCAQFDSMIKRIPINKVEIGMYVSDETPLPEAAGLRSKGLIKRDETIQKLRRQNIGELFIDVDKGIDSAFALPVLSKPDVISPTVELEEEREAAGEIYNNATNLVDTLMQDAKLGKAIDIGPVDDLAHEINNSVLRNPNALMCLAQIQDKDKYLLEHSINVGILLGVFAKYLGYDQNTVHHLVTGGLLHDIGKIRVPDQVLNKPGKLNEPEWVLMRKHVEYGMETLNKSKGIHDISKQICGMHHEKLDGSGYPYGLEGQDISIYGRIASIIDIYDAVTATRVYHEGRNPFKAMKLLHELAGDHLDKELVYSFIRCMSVYPVGTLVRLSNHTLALVITTAIGAPDRPVVKIIYDLSSKKPLPTQTLDLACTGNTLKIVGIHEASGIDINVNDFL